jgi:hypothetical protein
MKNLAVVFAHSEADNQKMCFLLIPDGGNPELIGAMCATRARDYPEEYEAFKQSMYDRLANTLAAVSEEVLIVRRQLKAAS